MLKAFAVKLLYLLNFQAYSRSASPISHAAIRESVSYHKTESRPCLHVSESYLHTQSWQTLMYIHHLPNTQEPSTNIKEGVCRRIGFRQSFNCILETSNYYFMSYACRKMIRWHCTTVTQTLATSKLGNGCGMCASALPSKEWCFWYPQHAFLSMTYDWRKSSGHRGKTRNFSINWKIPTASWDDGPEPILQNSEFFQQTKFLKSEAAKNLPRC